MPWFWTIGGRLDEAAHHMRSWNLSNTGMGFINFVQNGFQNNSQESTRAKLWQFAKAHWTAILTKVTTSWDALPLGTRGGTISTSWEANDGVWNTNFRHRQSKINSNKRRSSKSVIDALLGGGGGGLCKCQFWNATKTKTQQYRIHYSEMLRDRLKPALRTKRQDYCRKVSQFFTTMPVLTLPHPPLKASGNWNLRCLSILRIVLIWPLRFPSVWPTERCSERPKFRQWPGSERCSACVTSQSTKNIFFSQGPVKACGPLD
jgi:hypothetical protein